MPYKTKGNRLVNEVTLGDGYPLSSNLKPLKVGGKASPLEMASAYPDDSVKGKVKINGDLEVVGSTTGISTGDNSTEFRYLTQGGFNYSSTAPAAVFLPLNGYIIEFSFSGGLTEYQSFVAPYDGYLNQVIMRSEEACGESTVGFHKSSTGTESPNSTAAASVTVDMTADDTATKFAFTSNNTFSAGDIINVSFAPENDANDTVFTCEFILDSSSGL